MAALLVLMLAGASIVAAVGLERASSGGTTPAAVPAAAADPAAAPASSAPARSSGAATVPRAITLSAGGVVAPSIRIGATSAPKALTATWAPVLGATTVFAAPDVRARHLGRLSVRTIDGTTGIVEVLAHTERAGAVWVKVRFPSRAGTPGWVLRPSLGGYVPVDTRIVISTTERRLTVLRGGRTIFSAPVGVGTASNPTPHGEFYIVDRMSGYDDPAYGPVAFATSALSATLTDWPGGGIVGIHGTDQPDLIPGRVSHGCVRLRNEDVVRLGRLVPVGAPITIL